MPPRERVSRSQVVAALVALASMLLPVAACTLVGTASSAAPPVSDAGVAGAVPGGTGAPAADEPEAHREDEPAGEPPATTGESAGSAEGPGSEPGRPAAGQDTPAGAVPRPYREVRALWVVRFTLADPDSIRTMVRRADEAGFNTLLVQIRGRGDALYRERLEPRSTLLAKQPADFDPLALTIAEAHARGIEVHGWMNTFLVASAADLPRQSGHLVNARPHLLAVPKELARTLYRTSPRDPRYVQTLAQHARRNSRRIEGLYVSPVSSEVHDHVYALWTDIASRYELDGLHFDYVRFPAPDFDYSKEALIAFRDWIRPRVDPGRRARTDRAFESDPLAWVDAFPTEWGEFRRERITRLVDRVYRGVKEVRPDLAVTAAVFPDPVEAVAAKFQDWPAWLRTGIVDAVAPMAYTDNDDTFRSQVRQAVALAGSGDRVWAGIGAYRNTFRGTVGKIGIAREETARGIVLFSYDWAAREGRADGGGAYLWRLAEEAFGPSVLSTPRPR